MKDGFKYDMIGELIPAQGGIEVLLKRSLPAVPIVLFFLLSACGNGVPLPPDAERLVNQTQTARAWTPTFSHTPSYISQDIVKYLNYPLPEDGYLINVKELEDAMGASYRVVDVLLEDRNDPDVILRINVHCQCAKNNDCCSPERMFVIIMRKMENYRDSLMPLVPVTVKEMNVYCSNHESDLPVMAARWSDINDFLYNRISGYQLGDRIWRK